MSGNAKDKENGLMEETKGILKNTTVNKKVNGFLDFLLGSGGRLEDMWQPRIASQLFGNGEEEMERPERS
jgi:hypothetical protein